LNRVSRRSIIFMEICKDQRSLQASRNVITHRLARYLRTLRIFTSSAN